MMKSIQDADIKNKTVFLRVDYNVPLEDKRILDDNRVRATLPTIEYLRQQNCKIIIGTHIGRPDGHIIPQLSTTTVAADLSKLIAGRVYATDYIVEPAVKREIKAIRNKDILVLGNLRWHSEEEGNNENFARHIASYADIYVNDAFACSHRAHASVDAITKYLPSYAGILLEREVSTLKLMMDFPRKPFVLILGGAKIADKIGILTKFAEIADNVLIGGAIANTFKYHNGERVSHSLYEAKAANEVKKISEIFGQKLVLPIDDVREDLGNGEFRIMDIGPKTVENWRSIIIGAKTIFWNGNLGYTEDERYQKGTLEVANLIRQNQFTKIIAGGDTVGFIDQEKIASDFSFISTGGGATLEFLAGIELPGLKALGYYED